MEEEDQEESTTVNYIRTVDFRRRDRVRVWEFGKLVESTHDN